MTIEIQVTTTEVGTVEEVTTLIEVAGAGPQGPQGEKGDKGDTGAGVPSGGVEFDLIEKASATDFDTRYTSKPTVKGVRFNTADVATLDQAGDIGWDDLDQALAYRTDGLTIDIGQENLVYVRNPPGNSTLPKGAVVAVKGASSNRLEVELCDSTAGSNLGCRTLGVVMGAIPSPGFGFVSTFGLLREFNTNNIIGGGVTEGSELFISSTPGVLSTQPQASPGRRVTVGYVVTTGVQGSIFVTVRRGLSVNELDNVLATSPADGQVLRYSTADGRYNLDTLGTAADSAATDFDPAGSASAVQSNLTTHIGDTSNPHQVDKTQVGLGNVDNVSAADLRDRATHTGTQAGTTVTYNNALSGLTATNMQDAIDEIANILSTVLSTE